MLYGYFEAWTKDRLNGSPDDPVPADLLKSHDPGLVCKWLCRFVLETRKDNGEPYPPATLRCLLSGINRVLQRNNAPFSILDKGDVRFKDLTKTLDTISSELHRQGIGAKKHSAEVITSEHEDAFWKTGLLGFATPASLQRTVFFYVGMNFVLRGIQEQHDLVQDQFVRSPSVVTQYDASVFYEYTEFVSKNNQHRFKDTDSKNKSVRVYAQPGSDRCLVKILDTYLSSLPKDFSLFYARPLGKFNPDPSKPSYGKQRLGVNSLKKFIPELSAKSGIGVHYTNHSLRATAITRMFNAGIPEKIIAENSGHRSVKALRCYERTSDEQQKEVSKVVTKHKVDSEAVEAGHEVAALPEVAAQYVSQSLQVSTKCMHPHVMSPSLSGNFSGCTINIGFK